MPTLKVKEFPGLTRVAPETIEKHEMEQALRDAQFALDVQLHDLRAERGRKIDRPARTAQCLPLDDNEERLVQILRDAFNQIDLDFPATALKPV